MEERLLKNDSGYHVEMSVQGDQEPESWEGRARHAIEEIVGSALDDEEWPADARSKGARVRVIKDPNWNGPWRQEFDGTINDLQPPELVKHPMANSGEYAYFVKFDEPQMDHTNLGPYSIAQVWDRYRVPIDNTDQLRDS
jgi:hypothetical protein